jgi:phosphatidylglycerol lysyltransferase
MNNTNERLKSQLKIRSKFAVNFTCILVTAYGAYLIANTLTTQIIHHHHMGIGHLTRTVTDVIVDVPLLIGLTAVYLGVLLKRRKRTAWIVAILATTLYLGIGLSQAFNHYTGINSPHPIHYAHKHLLADIITSVVFPFIILLTLYGFRKEFVVKSDVQGFKFAVRISVVVLFITLLYGVAGFMLLDSSDFHQEINTPTAIHYTIDQFNITTTKPIHPYTRRAEIFVDSLSFISYLSVIYVVLSLFQPLRFRFSDQTHNRTKTLELMNKYGAPSEEFFKLWPHDKSYFFDDTQQSALAFHVYKGVALVLSDPIGNPDRFKPLLAGFNNLCFNNDWLPALIHVSDAHYRLYEACGYSMQKLGQEAVVDLEHFVEGPLKDKYFRQINNKFNKQGYSFELLKPPHHKAVVERLRTVSDEWLAKGNKSERGFAMAYFTDEYVSMCEIAVVRDAADTIQAFLNLIPAEFDHEEATYDMLRQANKAQGNITDYLLINFMAALREQGYARINLGLSPLSGLDKDTSEDKTMLDNVLKVVYANGDMFFSFSGLHRFKSKYEPKWQDKYVGYKGGITGFSKTMTSLTRYMTKSVNLK